MKLGLLALLLSAGCASAASDFSFTGTFTSDDQVQLFDFSLSGTGTVVQGFGYGGGTNAAGTVISAGGFDTLFTIFQSDGTQVGYSDDGRCATTGPRAGSCLDSFFNNSLGPGSYILAITVSGNYPNGDLSQGFGEDGKGNFTATGACPMFCDIFGNTSNGNFAVDFLNVDSAAPESSTAAPEPAALALMGSGLFCLALGLRRRSFNSITRSSN